jgi:hypothetical protein
MKTDLFFCGSTNCEYYILACPQEMFLLFNYDNNYHKKFI